MFRYNEIRYLILFVVLVVYLTGLAVWYEAFYYTKDSLPKTIKSIGQEIGSAVATGIAVIAILALVVLISERYKQRRYEEGRADERKRWEDWNDRRMAAEARGEKFDEPPPSPTREP